MLADTLSLFPDLPPAPPPPRRHRCPLCRAGFAPVGASQRLADQRAKAGRDYTAAWDAEIARHPADEDVIAACVRELYAAAGRPIGMPAVWEALRGKVAVNLDNCYRAPAGRRLPRRYPDLAGMIVTRAKAGQVRERAR